METMLAAGEIDFDSQGNMYAAVAFQNRVLVVPADGGEPSGWGSEGDQPGQFVTPIWILVSPQDHIYVSDHSGRVQRFDSSGNLVGLWSDPENGDGPLAAAASLGMDIAGNIYVAPKDRAVIYVLSQ
jgi:DNA-binding beta-propeller fold protein YncE